jgi:riboflavin biosynthesis pyrimidine reductase
MRRLFPEPAGSVDPMDAYTVARPPHRERPWLLVNMVASADGAATVDGLSGSLGGAPDRAAFTAIRSVPDVILVGAGTVRAEHYGPPRPTPEVQERRVARGQAAVPRLAIVSGRLDLDPTAALFTKATERPLVLTGLRPDPERSAALAAVADVIEVEGEEGVDPGGIVRVLAQQGASTVLCEGGPTLNGRLDEADLIDEWCLTVAPAIVSGASGRIVAHAPAAVRELELAHVLEEDGVLLLRYVRRR